MQQYRPQGFSILPPVIKNLIIINGLAFLLLMVWQGANLNWILGMFPFQSENFQPYQIVTHMFMHGGLGHIFFNMFALWMFGSPLENVWGPKRFLIFYLVTGLGAALCLQIWNTVEIYQLQQAIADGGSVAYEAAQMLKLKLSTPTVGASGAVFGVLLGFGMLFPNTLIYIYFLFPVKAKYFVIFYGALELYMGIANNPGDNIAHFAHLGGMLIGFILIKIWQRDRRHFY